MTDHSGSATTGEQRPRSPHSLEPTMNTNPTTKRKRNWTHLTVLAIVRGYMIGALSISFTHIITTAGMLGLHGWQAGTTPFAIDGYAVLGLIARSHRFAPATQRMGLRLQISAGILSLACNIYAGHTIGERIYGALIVGAFIVAEIVAGRLFPAAAPAPVPTAEELQAAQRSASASKAAATRKANKEAAAAKKAAAAERRRLAKLARDAELAAMADGEVPANAPVSPAVI